MPTPSLSEDDRARLDGIVQQMQANHEPDEAIQFVVNDFKNKYQPASLGQFGENVVTSAKNFGGNMVKGLVTAGKAAIHPLDTGSAIVKGAFDTGQGLAAKAFGDVTPESQMVDRLGQGVQEAGHELNNRYGSWDAIKQTAYTDPVGMAADASMLIGGPSGLVKGATRAGTVANDLARIGVMTGDVLNPLTVPLKVAGKVTEAAGIVPTLVTVRPSRKIIKDLGVSRSDFGRLVNQEGIATSEDAFGRMASSKQGADAMVNAASQAGGQIPIADLENALEELRPDLKVQQAGGKASQEAALDERIANLKAQHPSGFMDLDTARALKRSLQQAADQAYAAEKRGAPINSLDALMDKRLARALREGVGTVVPGVTSADTATNTYNKIGQAFKFAEDRPAALSKLFGLSNLGAGHITTGLLSLLLDSPYYGAKAGRVLTQTGAAVQSPELLRSLLLSRLTGATGDSGETGTQGPP